MTKLTAYLNPTDGKFSKFYDERLKRYFEESNGQLKLKDTAELKFSDEFIAYLNNAMNLRKALFGTSATPKFEYEFNLKPVQGSLVEITIDGQKATSDATGSIKGTFPASGTETGVFIKFGRIRYGDHGYDGGQFEYSSKTAVDRRCRIETISGHMGTFQVCRRRKAAKTGRW